MLVIPIQTRPNWTRPPLVTVLLILINVLVFVLYQGRDEEVFEKAAHIYHDAGLLEHERPVYRLYLENQKAEPAAGGFGFWHIAFDRSFDSYLRQHWQQTSAMPEQTLARWQQDRERFERQRNRLSSLAAGLVPAESRVWTYVSSLFLHGGWGHLLGNMVFLFLFGFTLEVVLGARLYLAFYTLSGIAAGGLYVLLNSASQVPLVGASGAISGLMGMYVCLYRLRKIRFFYSVLFYFGEFRAPAILILPLWLVKELYGHFFTESNVAYMAHIGGLIAGAGLMQLARSSQQEFEESEETAAQQDEVAAGLKRVQAACSQLDYDRARAIARLLCQSHPGDWRGWRALFDLHKLQPQQPAFHKVVTDCLAQLAAEPGLADSWQGELEELLAQYRTLAPEAPALTGDLSLGVAKAFWRCGRRAQAEPFIRIAMEKKSSAPALQKFINDCLQDYRQIGQFSEAKRLETLMQAQGLPGAP